MAAAKKIAKKPARAAATPTKKAPAKKRGVKPAKKVVARKAPAKRAATKKAAAEHTPREFDQHGFVVGSDSSILAEILVEGSEKGLADLVKIATPLIKKNSGLTSASGADRNVRTLLTTTANRHVAKGYTIVAPYRIDPPVKKTAAKRPAKKVARKA